MTTLKYSIDTSSNPLKTHRQQTDDDNDIKKKSIQKLLPIQLKHQFPALKKLSENNGCFSFFSF